MRIMSWNIEWMNNWFTGGDHVAWKKSDKNIASVAALAKRVAKVIKDVDPDVLTIQEGPSDHREMQLFINKYLSKAGKALFDQFGGLDGVSQKLYVLVKKGGAFKNPSLARDEGTLGCFEEWLADVDGDCRLESYHFTRNPLVVNGTINPGNKTIRLVNLHTKSNFVNGQQDMWEDPLQKQTYIEAALKNRRRISCEAMRVRSYLDGIMKADKNALVAVAGDLNDGPGFDYFEKNYLTHGVTDIILGSTYFPKLQFKHALIETVSEDDLYTVIFDDFVDGIKNRHLLLDHLIFSPYLATRVSSARVCHKEYNAQEDPSRPSGNRDRFASDHRPVVVEIS